jgi:hypothetical protein
MTREEEWKRRIGAVVGKGLSREEPVRLELLSDAQATGEWHLISGELHSLLTLYAQNKVSDKALEIYATLLTAPSSEYISFSVVARDLYLLELYDSALDAVQRGTTKLAQGLSSGKYPLAQNIPFFYQYFSLEIAILSEIDPASPRIPELKASLSFAVTQRRMNIDYLYSAVTNLAAVESLDRSLKNITLGLISDIEMTLSMPQEANDSLSPSEIAAGHVRTKKLLELLTS